eukprot:scaffold162035_cov18-Tisochrysis_lutea.AAC.2
MALQFAIPTKQGVHKRGIRRHEACKIGQNGATSFKEMKLPQSRAHVWPRENSYSVQRHVFADMCTCACECACSTH